MNASSSKNTYMLPSTKKSVMRYRRMWGDRNFVRWCRNLGISFEDTYVFMFGKMPKT